MILFEITEWQFPEWPWNEFVEDRKKKNYTVPSALPRGRFSSYDFWLTYIVAYQGERVIRCTELVSFPYK